MAKDSKLDHLSQVRLFAALSKKELTTIGRASDEVKVAAGKTIVDEGSSGHEFFLILDGTASVKRGGRKIATLGPGQYFGEMALLDRGPRSATIVADTDMTLLVLGQREFSGVLDEIPGLAHKLLSTMAARLREADSRAASVSH
jgi:CRP/FNR family cyclic AMP-dependent transcriptional regulator